MIKKWKRQFENTVTQTEFLFTLLLIVNGFPKLLYIKSSLRLHLNIAFLIFPLYIPGLVKYKQRETGMLAYFLQNLYY